MELVLESVATNFRNKLIGGSLATLITLTQFTWCFLIPLVCKPETLKTISIAPAKIGPYMAMAFVVSCATVLATASLYFVAYPVKIVFKSCKLIPTMILSTVLLGSTHSLGDYISAVLLCMGTALFVYRPQKNSVSTSDDGSSWGCLLLLLSVVCDSLLPNIQKRMMSKASPEEVMVNTNLVGMVGMLAYMCVFSDHLDSICAYFAMDDDMKLVLLLQLSIVGSSLGFAVLCYTSLIHETGPVVAVTVSTMRKVVTMVLSYVIFSKALNWTDLAALVLIGLGIFVENFSKRFMPLCEGRTNTVGWRDALPSLEADKI